MPATEETPKPPLTHVAFEGPRKWQALPPGSLFWAPTKGWSDNMGLPVSAIPGKAHHYALVRRCDVCGKVNAIDLDGSTENEQAMQEVDHTVTRMSRAEAQEAWEGAGRCDHKAIIADLRAQLAAQNAIAQTPPDSGTKNL